MKLCIYFMYVVAKCSHLVLSYMKQNKLSRVHSTDWKSSLISGEIYAQISKKKPLCSVYLEAGLGKWGRQKRIRMLE